jgi:hypothetical protein
MVKMVKETIREGYIKEKWIPDYYLGNDGHIVAPVVFVCHAQSFQSGIHSGVV